MSFFFEVHDPSAFVCVCVVQHFFPRLRMLLAIYRGVRHVLYGEPEPDDAPLPPLHAATEPHTQHAAYSAQSQRTLHASVSAAAADEPSAAAGSHLHSY
jgi:hypothetical protein